VSTHTLTRCALTHSAQPAVFFALFGLFTACLSQAPSTGTSTLPWQFRFYFDKSLQKLHFGKRLKEDIDDTLTSSLIVLAWSGLAEAKIAEHAPLLDPRFLNRSIHGRSVLATVSYKFREVWS